MVLVELVAEGLEHAEEGVVGVIFGGGCGSSFAVSGLLEEGLVRVGFVAVVTLGVQFGGGLFGCRWGYCFGGLAVCGRFRCCVNRLGLSCGWLRIHCDVVFSRLLCSEGKVSLAGLRFIAAGR